MAETLPTAVPAGALPEGFAPLAARALDFAAQQVVARLRAQPVEALARALGAAGGGTAPDPKLANDPATGAGER
jgi:hypothetical protein